MFKLGCCLALLMATVHGEQKCTMQNGHRMYNGKPCASTTRYHDAHKGACGCGHDDTPFSWNQQMLVAAASQYVFDANGGSWCGSNCGKCVKLTPTGGSVPNEGTGARNTQAHVFMITNECPIAGNEKWCGQHGQHQTNTFGYEAHFDLEDGNNQMSNFGWDNPEVTYEFVNCDGQNTPTNAQWHQCECSH